MVTGSSAALTPGSVLDLADAEYVLLTTYTSDGRPKPTPMWAALDGDALVVTTEADSWKVRRARATPRVTLAACDARGNPLGSPVEGLALVVTDRLWERVEAAVVAKYGWKHRVIQLVRRFRRRPGGGAGLVIRDVPPPAPSPQA